MNDEGSRADEKMLAILKGHLTLLDPLHGPADATAEARGRGRIGRILRRYFEDARSGAQAHTNKRNEPSSENHTVDSHRITPAVSYTRQGRQLDSVSDSFPSDSVWASDHIGGAPVPRGPRGLRRAKSALPASYP